MQGRVQLAEGDLADVDPAAAAFTLVSTCYARVSMRLMALHEAPLPSLEEVIAMLGTALAPREPSQSRR